MFKCEVDLGNAAFHDDDGDFSPEVEVSRILRELSKRVERGEARGSLIDINGNAVGKYTIEE